MKRYTITSYTMHFCFAEVVMLVVCTFKLKAISLAEPQSSSCSALLVHSALRNCCK
jgi:hypothetical protein